MDKTKEVEEITKIIISQQRYVDFVLKDDILESLSIGKARANKILNEMEKQGLVKKYRFGAPKTFYKISQKPKKHK